jgi:hypothetical protein
MHRHGDAGIGCATSAPPEVNADAQLDAMVQRARAYKADAAKAPDSLSPERKAELQQLASDARAWQAGTGRNDIRVTDKRVTTARRADDGGGDTGNCDANCPSYSLSGDSICFLEKSECPTDEGDEGDLTFGTICIYSCISMSSE